MPSNIINLSARQVQLLRVNKQRALCTTAWPARTSVPALAGAHASEAAEQQVLPPEAVQLPSQPPQRQLVN